MSDGTSLCNDNRICYGCGGFLIKACGCTVRRMRFCRCRIAWIRFISRFGVVGEKRKLA